MNYEKQMLDREFRNLDQMVTAAYKRAERRATAVYDEYMEKQPGERLNARQRAVLEEIRNSPDEDEDLWEQLFEGDEWNEELAEMAGFYSDADEECVEYADDRMPYVYVEGRNIANYETDMHYHRDMGIDLLTIGTPGLLFPGKYTINRKKADQWNLRNLKNQFLVQKQRVQTVWSIGKRAIKQVTKRSTKSTGNTLQRYLWGVDDQAKWEHMMELARHGLDIEKEWVATIDGHTRETHRTLDHQRRKVDEEFEVGKYSIMFTRQPGKEPEMIYNCRCNTVYKFPKYEDIREPEKEVRIENIRPELPNGKKGERRLIPDMPYREWEKWKAEGN